MRLDEFIQTLNILEIAIIIGTLTTIYIIFFMISTYLKIIEKRNEK